MTKGSLSVLNSLWIRCKTKLPHMVRSVFHGTCLGSAFVCTYLAVPKCYIHTVWNPAQFQTSRNMWLLVAVTLDTASKPSFFRKMGIWWAQTCALEPMIRAARQICTWLLSEWNWLFKIGYWLFVSACLQVAWPIPWNGTKRCAHGLHKGPRC